jgi:serine/threonine protein kinase
LITSSPASTQRLGKYEFREKLGLDGVVEVWKAFDTEVHRYVTIKLLHANLQTDLEFINRFSREAPVVAALHHPNIVQIHEFQMIRSPAIKAPVAYMVMDCIEGETLADYIRTTSRTDKLPALADIVYLFASISKAIDYVHREGIIHGDIKPTNILLDKRHTASRSIGMPMLTDFGIAKIVGANSGMVSGMWLGTPLYVSPERAQGSLGTERSDIYSLGVILYEICTGICPFRGENVTAVMMQQIVSAPKPPALINPAIPPALSEAILCAMAKNPAERFSSASALTAAVAEALHLPPPAGLFLSAHLSNTLLEPTHVHPDRPEPSPAIAPQKVQQSQPKVSGSKVSPTPTSLPTVLLRRAWNWKLIACLVALCVLIGSTLVSLHALHAGPANPVMGTLTFMDSGQYDPNTTVGYNDIVSLSLHHLTAPGTGNAYFAWLMPDQADDGTVPILLGRLSVDAENATLRYASPAHTNLLAHYSGVRIIEQPASTDPSAPSQDPKTWRWDGWLPNTPTPGDPHQYSFLSHLRHLLAEDPTLHENAIPGGLVIWITRNVGKVQEWSSAAQGGWQSQMADGDADLIHRNLIRILDYLDGQTYVWQDVPAESPWLVDPVAGKLGLLSYTQSQEPPGYLQHVDIHLKGLTSSPSHTDEQKQITIQADSVITRMINDLTQVRKDATQLVKRNNDQLRQPDTLTLLNEMATLTKEANSGWFDTTTHDNIGGAIWLNMRIQQLATISLESSTQQ